MKASISLAGRVCGECRSCCEGWLSGRIRDHDMKPGTSCYFLKAKGCSIYADRPESPCRVFVCGWLMTDSPLPEGYRPDQLGVIFVPILWRDRRAWILVPAGKDPDENLMAQMRNHTQLTGEPHLIKKPDRLLCFGLPEFQQDMVSKSQRGESLW